MLSANRSLNHLNLLLNLVSDDLVIANFIENVAELFIESNPM